MNLIETIIVKMCDFAHELELFKSGQTIITDINVRQLNNYSILSYTFDFEKYTITLISMKHINNQDFETTKLFSEIRKDEMYIVNGDAYMIDDEFHADIYDKSDFFNMSVSGELICGFDYWFYKLFNDLRNCKKAESVKPIELQLKVKHECK